MNGSKIFIAMLAIAFIAQSINADAITFTHRKPITLVNGFSQELINYVIRINVTSSASMQADFDDIRFTNSTSFDTTQWLENYTNYRHNKSDSNWAVFWINVSRIPTGTSTIYAYYGNSTLSTMSDGAKTFPFFDDFNGTGSLGGWWTVTRNDVGCTLARSSDRLVGSCSSVGNADRIRTTQNQGPLFPGFAAEIFDFKEDVADAGRIFEISFRDQTVVSGTGATAGINLLATSTETWRSAIDAANFNSTSITSIGQDYTLAHFNQSGGDFGRGLRNYSLEAQSPQQSWNQTGNHTLFMNVEDAGTFSMDVVAMRRFASPEPVVTEGGEETDTQVKVSLDSPTNGFINTTLGSTPFRFTPTNPNASLEFANASLWHNSSGTFAFRIANQTIILNNTQSTISDTLSDGTYIWNIRVCMTSGSCTFNTTNFTYIVRMTPRFSNNVTSPASPQTWGPGVDNITFNITWSDDAQNFHISLIEHNLTGTMRNYTMSNTTPTIFNYTFFGRPTAGTYAYRFIGNDTVNNVNATSQLTYIINRRAANIQITSTQGFSFTVGPSTTLQATADSLAGTPTLQVNGITVSNPSSQTFAVGSHNITAFTSDATNFSGAASSVTLVVNPLSQCTSNSTFAFQQTVTSLGGIQSFNFSTFFNSSQVRYDLGDVFSPNVTNVTRDITKNISGTNFIININTTGLTSFWLQWGNYFVRNTWSNGAYNATGISEPSGTQINNYSNVRLLNEIDFTPLHPPNATNTLFIECELGESVITVENTNHSFLLATEAYINRSLMQVKYSADSFYSRQLLPNASSVVALNFYLVDAFQFAVDRIDFIMADPDFYGSKLIVYKTIGSQLITITEGLFDASHLFSAFLREDARYSIKAVLGSTSRDFGEILVVAPATKTLGDIKIQLEPQTKTVGGNLVMQAFMNTARTNLTTQYIDSLERTINVTITIYHQNGTIFDQTVYTSDSITASFNTTGFEDEAFTVRFLIHHEDFDSVIYHTVSLQPGGLLFDVEASNVIMFIASLVIAIIVASAITSETLVAGSIATALIVILTMMIGWFPDNLLLLIFMIMLMIFGIIVHIKKRGQE